MFFEPFETKGKTVIEISGKRPRWKFRTRCARRPPPPHNFSTYPRGPVIKLLMGVISRSFPSLSLISFERGGCCGDTREAKWSTALAKISVMIALFLLSPEVTFLPGEITCGYRCLISLAKLKSLPSYLKAIIKAWQYRTLSCSNYYFP